MTKLPTLIRNLLFPRVRCLGCDEPRQIDPGAALCDDCVRELEKLRLNDGVCPHCLSFKRGEGACSFCANGGMQHLVGAWAPFRYHGVSQKLVVRLKFGGIHHAAEPLIDAMLHAMPSSGFGALVPISLHKQRRRERGFDQAVLLAERISLASGLPVVIALERIKKTKRQSSLSHDKRQDNMEGSFQAILPVKNMRLLLVDDVRTSGATARACAKALREAGAERVGLLTATVAAGYSESLSSVTAT